MSSPRTKDSYYSSFGRASVGFSDLITLSLSNYLLDDYSESFCNERQIAARGLNNMPYTKNNVSVVL